MQIVKVARYSATFTLGVRDSSSQPTGKHEASGTQGSVLPIQSRTQSSGYEIAADTDSKL